MRNVALGALAGLCATMAMTMAMRRLHQGLPPHERYPLPPREVTERALPEAARADGVAATLLAHFGYGGLAGAVYACLPRPRPPGIVYGPAIWAISYLGWIPAAGLLVPASDHPRRRNALMLLAHIVWGIALSGALTELQLAAKDSFGRGELRDARSNESEAHV